MESLLLANLLLPSPFLALWSTGGILDIRWHKCLTPIGPHRLHPAPSLYPHFWLAAIFTGRKAAASAQD